MINAFKNRAVDGLAGLSSMPEALAKDSSIIDYNIPLTSEVLLFFKTSEGSLQDLKLRQALAYATNTTDILTGLSRPVLPANGPLLNGQLGYDPAIKQTVGDRLRATQLLDEAGWKASTDGIRKKDGQPLTFTLLTQDNDVYSYVAQAVKKQWQAVGVQLNIVKQTDQDLQSSLANHVYDILLYGVSLGPDPDVYAYWHSSQADIRSPNRLNFSEYRSGAADSALEAGRTRTDPTVRAIKYRPFLEAWVKDVPAVALYQPRYLYLTRAQIANFHPTTLNSGADRFNNIDSWMILQKKQPIR
jgi:peptide/nickel transport system substrate-binding protein